jgi:hypothetical protein
VRSQSAGGSARQSLDALDVIINGFDIGHVVAPWSLEPQRFFFMLEQLVQLTQSFAARRSHSRLLLCFLTMHFNKGNRVGDFVASHSCFH